MQEQIEAPIPELPIAALDPEIYRDTFWCPNCAGPRMFIEIFEFEGGRLICCQGCGDEKRLPFTRTTTVGVVA